MATSLLDAWLAFSRDNTNLQQFGQGNDYTTFNGATGCTHTILQRLIKAAGHGYVSHDSISHIAGYPSPSQNKIRRGLNSTEVARVMHHFALPMKVLGGTSFDDLKAYRDRGPIGLAVMYSWWPEERGCVYMGRRADGKPNGFAVKNGKTQLSGFTGRHMTLWLGSKSIQAGKDTLFYSYANEPNHGSPSRPERPSFDTMTTRQVRNAYDSYANANGGKRYAWVPTHLFRPKGY